MIVIDTKEKEMIYSRAYRELYVIISNLTKEMKEKIPKNVIENISRKMDITYDFRLENNDIFNSEYMVETKALFLELYTRYIAEDEEDFWEVYKEKRNDLLKKEIEKEYVVRKEESSIKIEDGIDIVNNIIEEKEEKSLLPSEIRENNIIEKFFNKIMSVKTYYIIKIDWLLLVSLVVSGLLSFLVFNLLKRNPEIETAIGKRQKIITMLSVVLFGLLHIANIENLHWELTLLYPVYALPQMILGYVSSVQRLKLGFVWGLFFHSMINLMAFLR